MGILLGGWGAQCGGCAGRVKLAWVHAQCGGCAGRVRLRCLSDLFVALLAAKQQNFKLIDIVTDHEWPDRPSYMHDTGSTN